MTPTIQIIILAFLGVLFGLSALSRRYPHIAWLQAFHIKRPQLTEAQRDRMRRRANIHVAIEFILLGFAVPIVYVGSSVMMFNVPSTLGLTISGLIGFALIALGLVAIWQNRHSRFPRGSNRERELYQRLTGRSWDPPKAD